MGSEEAKKRYIKGILNADVWMARSTARKPACTE